jgi:hypothetical protein
MWLARGWPPGKLAVIFKYNGSRKAENIDEFIDGFHGFPQTDGCVGYDSAVGGRTDITHMGCFTHGRWWLVPKAPN